jgi:hypothetical protein
MSDWHVFDIHLHFLVVFELLEAVCPLEYAFVHQSRKHALQFFNVLRILSYLVQWKLFKTDNIMKKKSNYLLRLLQLDWQLKIHFSEVFVFSFKFLKMLVLIVRIVSYGFKWRTLQVRRPFNFQFILYSVSGSISFVNCRPNGGIISELTIFWWNSLH